MYRFDTLTYVHIRCWLRNGIVHVSPVARRKLAPVCPESSPDNGLDKTFFSSSTTHAVIRSRVGYFPFRSCCRENRYKRTQSHRNLQSLYSDGVRREGVAVAPRHGLIFVPFRSFDERNALPESYGVLLLNRSVHALNGRCELNISDRCMPHSPRTAGIFHFLRPCSSRVNNSTY